MLPPSRCSQMRLSSPALQRGLCGQRSTQQLHPMSQKHHTGVSQAAPSCGKVPPSFLPSPAQSHVFNLSFSQLNPPPLPMPFALAPVRPIHSHLSSFLASPVHATLIFTNMLVSFISYIMNISGLDSELGDFLLPSGKMLPELCRTQPCHCAQPQHKPPPPSPYSLHKAFHFIKCAVFLPAAGLCPGWSPPWNNFPVPWILLQ